MDDWMLRLKGAYDAGYYKTEAASEQQSGFPWQDKRCGDCPFWMNNVCQVDLRRCSSDDAPCLYYDPPDFTAATWEIDKRLDVTWTKIWRWEDL